MLTEGLGKNCLGPIKKLESWAAHAPELVEKQSTTLINHEHGMKALSTTVQEIRVAVIELAARPLMPAMQPMATPVSAPGIQPPGIVREGSASRNFQAYPMGVATRFEAWTTSQDADAQPTRDPHKDVGV